jgi:hypothetical protein
MEHKFFGTSCMISHIITKNRGKCIEGEMISHDVYLGDLMGHPRFALSTDLGRLFENRQSKNGEHFMSNVDKKIPSNSVQCQSVQ